MAISNVIKNSVIFGKKTFENRDLISEMFRLNPFHNLFKNKQIIVSEKSIKGSVKKALDQYPSVDVESVRCFTDNIAVDLLINKLCVKASAKISIRISEGKLNKKSEYLIFEIVDKNLIGKNVISKIVSSIMVDIISSMIDKKLDNEDINNILKYDKKNRLIKANIFEIPKMRAINANKFLNFFDLIFSHCEGGISVVVNT